LPLTSRLLKEMGIFNSRTTKGDHMYNEEKNLYRRVVRTLRRIPPDIRQELATRDFDMMDSHSCLIGTAVRAGLARAQNLATEDITTAERYEPASPPSFSAGSRSRGRKSTAA
jgi:hypothetical protein